MNHYCLWCEEPFHPTESSSGDYCSEECMEDHDTDTVEDDTNWELADRERQAGY